MVVVEHRSHLFSDHRAIKIIDVFSMAMVLLYNAAPFSIDYRARGKLDELLFAHGNFSLCSGLRGATYKRRAGYALKLNSSIFKAGFNRDLTVLTKNSLHHDDDAVTDDAQS